MENEKTPVQAADLEETVENVVKEKNLEGKQPKDAPVIKVKQIVEPKYIDPITEEYQIKRNNLVGTPLNRNSEEGIKSLHITIHLMGEQPVW